MKRIPWTMDVAVISTAHMPPDYTGSGHHFKSTDPTCGPVVYIDDLVQGEDPDWLIELADLLVDEDGDRFGWVRFDRDADKIEGAVTFDWEGA